MMAGISDQAMLEPGSRFKYQSKGLDTALGVDLYDFGARYYDEQIGRFNQIDPASQFASGYVGMGNNWINGTDPNGEYFGLDDLAAGLIGGIFNLTSNLIHGNVHNVWQGFGYFGLGFGGGVTALYPEFGGWFASGALLGGGDALLQGKSWSEVGRATGLGIISSVAGGAVGSEVSSALGGVLGNIASPVFKNLIGGVAGGYAGGFAGSFAASAASGSSLSQAVSDGFNGGIIGGVSGSAAAVGMSFIEARQYDVNPWTGRLNAAKQELQPLNGQVGYQGLNDDKSEEWLSPNAKGELGVQRAINEIKARGGKILGREITLEVDGVRVRVDVAADFNGKIELIEVKNGPNARFTPNQSIVYPQMENNVPVIPRGANAEPIWGPEQIGQPTTQYYLRIIKYNN